VHDAGLRHVEIHHLNAPLPPGYAGPAWPPPVDIIINVLPPQKP